MMIYPEEISFNILVQHYILMSNVIHSLLALLYEVWGKMHGFSMENLNFIAGVV